MSLITGRSCFEFATLRTMRTINWADFYQLSAVGVFSIGLMVLGTRLVSGQDYPGKPIRIVTSVAGGGSDYLARQMALAIAGPLGQPVLVDNRASAIVGEAGSKVPADGYTLTVQGASLWLNTIMQKMTYDVERDFSPITMISRDVFVLVAHPSLPVKSVKELIALAKSRPGELNYSSSAPGGTPHLGMELLKSMSGINIVAIPYKGAVLAYNAVLAGETAVTVANTVLGIPHAKAGRVRALAVTSLEPTALAPGLPTVASAGLPGYELVGATGLWAPAKTSAPIIIRINQEVVRFLNRAETKERFFTVQQEIVASSPEQFAAAIRSDLVKWAKVIKDAGIKTD